MKVQHHRYPPTPERVNKELGALERWGDEEVTRNVHPLQTSWQTSQREPPPNVLLTVSNKHVKRR